MTRKPHRFGSIELGLPARLSVWLLPLLLLSARHAAAQSGIVAPNPEQQGLPLNWRVAPPAPSVKQPVPSVAAPAVPDQVLAAPIGTIDVQAPDHEAEIRTMAQPMLGQSRLTGEALEALRARIWNLYRRHGRLAGIDIAAREGGAAGGASVLQIRVREMRVQGVQLQPAGAGKVDSDVREAVLDDVRRAIPDGSALDLDRLDGSIRRRQFLGDASVYAMLAPVGNDALDVKLHVAPPAAVADSGVAQTDNFGMRSYGRARYTAGVALPVVITAGDRLSLLATFSQNMTYGRASYEAPVASLGARVAGWAAHVAYRAPSGVAGDVTQFGANATVPLYFGQASIWTAYLDYENRRQQDRIADIGMLVNDKHVNSVQARVDASFLLNKTETLYLSLGLQQGWLDLSALPSALEQDRHSARSDGTFTKLDWTASWTGLLDAARKFDARVEARGQFARTNLDDSEKMALGGPNAVRAYDSSHAMGDQGTLVTAELGYKPSAPLRLYGFYDMGQTRRNHAPWIVDSVPQSYTLQGAGLGLSYTSASVNAMLTWARRIGSDPASSLSGEGAHDRNQLWLSLSGKF